MEDDDDAFLYGDEPAAAPPAASKTEDAVNGTASAQSASTADVAAKTNADAEEADDDEDEDEQDGDDDDDDDDDDDSDSDIEFIIDATQEAQQPARPGLQRPGAPGARPLPTQSTPQRPQSTLTSEYTPLSRSQLLAAASPASATPGAASTTLPQPPGAPPGAPPVKPSTALDTIGPEGGPPPVPSTAPRLSLSPGPEDRTYPKPEDVVEQEESSNQDIFDIDLENLPEKPWRRYGADLTDYFNYGFNEESWTVWRGKKERMTDSRKMIENNMFGGGGSNGDMMANMQQMMAMMPPPPQAMQAMMGQNGMPPMPPDQMMAMMASMSGMPAMPPMPGMGNMPPLGPRADGGRGMNNMMMPGMFGGQPSNGGGPGEQQQQQQRFSHSPFPTGPAAQQQHDGHNSPYPQPPTQPQDDRPKDQQAEHDPSHGWDTPSDFATTVKQEGADDTPTGPGAPPLKPMSEADMSAFFGASGIDPSQAAAAGFPVSTHDDAKKIPSGPSSKPAPPKSAPSGPAAAKGTSIRGRAAAAAGVGASTSSRSGRAVSPTLPPNVPLGPKSQGKRYNDRDTGTGAADSLDYGATAGGVAADDSGRDSRDRSPDRGHRRSGGRSRREGTHDTANGDESRRATTSSRSGKRPPEEFDDETASQSSHGGSRRRRTGGSSSHRSESHRESSSSHREREREREKEREREARSQARSDRRAGRDVDEPPIPTGPSGGRGSRKRSAPEEADDADVPVKSRSGKGGSRKKR